MFSQKIRPVPWGPRCLRKEEPKFENYGNILTSNFNAAQLLGKNNYFSKINSFRPSKAFFCIKTILLIQETTNHKGP